MINKKEVHECMAAYISQAVAAVEDAIDSSIEDVGQAYGLTFRTAVDEDEWPFERIPDELFDSLSTLLNKYEEDGGWAIDICRSSANPNREDISIYVF